MKPVEAFMPGLSESQRKRARKNLTAVLQRLASVGQVRVAEAMDISESTVSRMKSDELDGFCTLLATLDLKIVPAALRCYDARQLEPLLELAKQRMDELRSVEQLTFEDTDIHFERTR